MGDTSDRAKVYDLMIIFIQMLATSICLFCFFSVVISTSVDSGAEEFTEELLLKPLPDRKVLAHFHFHSRVPPTITYGRHLLLFPKGIHQLVQKFRIREMELSLTQGRWNYEHWGSADALSNNNAKPPGVELWAVFDVPQHEVDSYWGNLTHALSGLFCASVNFLESSASYSAPNQAYLPLSGSLRYGVLPREAVCTENLTPWLKLLPCRDKAGISTLLHRSSIYRGFYHSQKLRLSSSEFKSNDFQSGTLMDLTLSVVLHPNSKTNDISYFSGQSLQQNWSLSSIFGRKLSRNCVLMRSSHVHIQIESSLVSHILSPEENQSSSDLYKILKHSWENPLFQLTLPPDLVSHEVNNPHGKSPSVLYTFLIEKYDDLRPFDVGLTWKHPISWHCSQSPIYSNRFLMGNGNERGGIAISLKSNKMADGFVGICAREDMCSLHVNIFQIIPWYIKAYYHSLKVFVDQKDESKMDFIEKMIVSPSKDKMSSGVMELVLKLPCSMDIAVITMDFDKAFLHVDDCPPDASQGFDIPSAVVTLSDFHSSMDFLEGFGLGFSPLLYNMKKHSSILSYTEALLVPLATPDFSMPYNVITITCTVFALYFGSLINVFRRRVQEEERLRLKSVGQKETGKLLTLLSKIHPKLVQCIPSLEHRLPSTAISSSLLPSYRIILKVILVVLIAIIYHNFFS